MAAVSARRGTSMIGRPHPLFVAIVMAYASFAEPAAGQDAFGPAPFCRQVLGDDLEGGLKRRTFEILEKADYFKGVGTIFTDDLYGIQSMASLSPADYDLLLQRGTLGDMPELLLKLKRAETGGDWSFGYQREIVDGTHNTAYSILARREAVAAARAGRSADVLKRFDDGRKSYLADAQPDASGAAFFNGEPDARIFLALEVMRQLVLDGFEQEAAKLAATAGDPRLPAFLQAMTDGRAGRRGALQGLIGMRDRIAWRNKFRNPVTPLGEFVFQAIAADRRELFDDLFPLFEGLQESKLLKTERMHSWLIERRALEPLLFLIAVSDRPDNMGIATGTAVMDELAQRGDWQALRRLQELFDRRPAGSPPGVAQEALRGSRVAALIRAGKSGEALALAGDTGMTGLIRSSANLAIPSLLVIFGDAESITNWKAKFNERQKLYIDLLYARKTKNRDEVMQFLERHEGANLFRGNAGLQLAYFSMNGAFETAADQVENWYGFIMKDPKANFRLSLEWLKLARQKCIGWTFTPFGREDGYISYSHKTSALSAGVGSYVLEDDGK